MSDASGDDDAVSRKWEEITEALVRLAARVGDAADFPVLPKSSLARDDALTHPLEVSRAVRHLINVSVDQLHGIVTMHAKAEDMHLAVELTLARAAIENTATALWILGPRSRAERILRVLQWYARDYQDRESSVGHLGAGNLDTDLETVRSVAVACGVDVKLAVNGYRLSRPLQEAQEYTTIQTKFLWAVASGFAHGRPWAYQGLLRVETLEVDESGHTVHLLRPRRELAAWLTTESVHLLGELLRLRDRRAGLEMPPMPDGTPDPGSGPI